MKLMDSYLQHLVQNKNRFILTYNKEDIFYACLFARRNYWIDLNNDFTIGKFTFQGLAYITFNSVRIVIWDLIDEVFLIRRG